MAVLALAVPALGFGTVPIIVALVLYGLLPIVRNTLVGIGGVSQSVHEAARGMGMTRRQRLLQVELPLAAPVILAGIRTSVTINIATAALGATVGASNLGDPIIAGIVNNNTAYIVQVPCSSACSLSPSIACSSDSSRRGVERRPAQGVCLQKPQDFPPFCRIGRISNVKGDAFGRILR